MFKRIRQDDETFHLFPAFRDRIVKFAKEFDIQCPIEPIVVEMTQRWFMAPNLAGYFLGLHNDTPYAHVAAWINSAYGQNKLYIYQAQADDNYANYDLMWPMLQNWLTDLNKGLPDNAKVTQFEFCTWHSEDLWMRYFRKKGVNSLALRHVIGGAIL
jgi:hypothetical protein